jgi:hypothetical protein
MNGEAHTTRNASERLVRRGVVVVCAVALVVLAGCKSTKEANGTNVSRDKNDPLFASGANLIPKQNVPVPDRATGSKGTKPDPLTSTSPTGGKVGYTDDPDRFKGTYIPGKGSTPAALAARVKDSEELKIADTGVTLTQAGGTLPGNAIEPPEDVEPLLTQLERFGVTRADRTLERENGKFTFRASVPISSTGARRQYVGTASTAREAVKQVSDQIVNEK